MEVAEIKVSEDEEDSWKDYLWEDNEMMKDKENDQK